MSDIPADKRTPNTKRCYFWNHQWTRWWDTNAGVMTFPDTGIVTGNFVVQTRVCCNCNKRQIRRITA